MSNLRTGVLFLMLSCLSACGNQIVEFGIDAGSSPDVGATIADAGADAGPVVGADAGTDAGAGADAGPGLDAGLPPTVTSTVPLSNAVGVPVGTAVSATFSNDMDPVTLTTTSFTLKQGATNVSGAVSYAAASKTASFVPAAPLTNGLVYTATITTGAKDTAGQSLAANYVWSFTTVSAAAAPTVTATTPLNNANNVALNVAPTATFSKAMDPLTLNAQTFTLKQGANAVTGSVTLNAGTNTATFTPAAPLSAGLVYTATITTGAKDTTGLPLAANFVWTFTTVSAPPTVVSTTPANLATNVSVTKKPTATFSTAMDPNTINGTTFTLKQGATTVTGTVTYNALTKTATFTPTTALGVGLVYTATITTGAKDSNGVPLAANFTWTFTTGACSMDTIDLRTAGQFAVLAGATVTNVNMTTVTGELGVSAGTAITGFPPGIVIGGQHPGDPTAAQAILDLTTAYNDAAGRSLCAVTKAGNLGGQTLPPGLYKSTSSLEISSGDLTLDANGDPDAVWIFQMASTLTTTAGRQVILAGGADAKNIFWQVGSSATLGTTSVFKGTIMADQAITLNTGATLTNGRALARISAVTLDGNTVTRP